MMANDILTVLAITFRAADAAGVERDAPALRLLNYQESKILCAGGHRENMQIPVLNVGNRNTDEIRGRRNFVRGRRSGIGACINEIRCEHKDYGETCGSGGNHP